MPSSVDNVGRLISFNTIAALSFEEVFLMEEFLKFNLNLQIFSVKSPHTLFFWKFGGVFSIV